MSNQWETVIGLEVHTELKTKSKIFCACSTEFGGEPNTHVCPVCLGMPGTLPVANKKVVDFAIKAGLALNCEIKEFNKFDRKNYYYPDLPKGYQISQFDLPVCGQGHLDIEVNGQTKRIGITRIHMEDDAGKLNHEGEVIAQAESSLVDYNRAGVPLLEIVSEPDMRSPEEAAAYLEKVKAILQYTEVSDCKMQEGSLRCDANISIRPLSATKLGTRTELKNMNSFKALQKALEYEVERHIELVEDGGTVVQETRSWDESKGMTVSLRSKEEAHDYRYFPDPDLVPLVIDEKWIESIRNSLPELPDERKQRLINDYDLPKYDAEIITSSKDLADYFDHCLDHFRDAKKISNWIMGELLRLLNVNDKEVADCPVAPKELGELLHLIEKGTISGKVAKQVFEEMFASGKNAKQIVKEKGLEQISDTGELEKIIEEIIAANPDPVSDYKSGKGQAIGFLVGQVMKASKGKANPQMVKKMLSDKLG